MSAQVGDQLELLPNEEFMVEAGRGDAVVELRLTRKEAPLRETDATEGA